MTARLAQEPHAWLNKVPEVTLTFWMIKIMSTTVGETAADYLAVDLGWGLKATGLFMATLLASALYLQIKTCRYTPWIYWLSVVLVSIVGTQITDQLTDGFGVSLLVSTTFFAAALGILFFVWYRVEQTLSIHGITSRRRELFYWGTILCTFALGTASGDLFTESLDLGFTWGAAMFGSLIALTYAIWKSGGHAIATFWIGYVLTRPFGAALGDLLTQPVDSGGLGMGTMWTSALFLAGIMALVVRAQLSMANGAYEPVGGDHVKNG